MEFNGYTLYVNDQDLPNLNSPWTRIELANKTFTFQRQADRTKSFSISGYIEMATWEDTRKEAEGLNNALLATPSGVFTDGYGTTYTVRVTSWLIKPVAAVNRYTFTMTCEMDA